MEQLSLFQSNATPINTITIVSHDKLTKSWQWILQHMSLRPTSHRAICLYDQKLWSYSLAPQPLEPGSSIPEILSVLYIASELGELKAILDMAKGMSTPEISISKGPLDQDVKGVINNVKRFRHTLSEHLAFWVRLADVAKSNSCSNFSCSRPNTQPEDKGPDGVFIEIGIKSRVEVQSVKSSINNPSTLISSKNFRSGKKVDRKKLLDGFWLQAYQNLGLIKLQNALSDACSLVDLSSEKRINLGLTLDVCAYNAVIVANNNYADSNLFAGYERINNDSSKCIATYIGSTEWTEVAEETRKCVINTLRHTGVW